MTTREACNALIRSRPQPGETFGIAGVRITYVPQVLRVLLAAEGGANSVYLIDATDGRRYTLVPRDEQDGVRFSGRAHRPD